jgi:hypothetical protein
VANNLDWYARKIASLRGGQAAPPAPQYRQPNHPQPQQQRPLPQVQQMPQQQQEMPPVTMENLYAAAGYWQGGQAHKVDREPCPECGSPQYYSRAGGARRGPPPAPHCYNCGYNGMFQQGEPSTWGAA